jgi:hypothetical protein
VRERRERGLGKIERVGWESEVRVRMRKGKEGSCMKEELGERGSERKGKKEKEVNGRKNE